MRRCRARTERSRWAASSSGVIEVISGAPVSGVQPVRQGIALGLVDFFFLCCAWLAASIEPTRSRHAATATARAWDMRKRGNKSVLQSQTSLALARGASVRVFPQELGVAIGEDFHQPPIKVVHRVVHDGLEATVILSMSFVNVITQSDAYISIFAA